MRNTATTVQEIMDREGLTPERTRKVANGLGWFSIGLGLAEVLAPRALARFLGMKGSEPVLMAYGVREIVTGIGILTAKDQEPWILGRVAGDGLDILSLLKGVSEDNPKQANVVGALAMVGGITAVDLLTAQALSEQKQKSGSGARRRLAAYRQRRGMPRSPEEMRGAASDFRASEEFRGPAAMRPWT
jgi:hypothetical protein